MRGNPTMWGTLPLPGIRAIAKFLECKFAMEYHRQPATKNGEQLRLRFLAFRGCREQEALGVRWDHVDPLPQSGHPCARHAGSYCQAKTHASHRPVRCAPQAGIICAKDATTTATHWSAKLKPTLGSSSLEIPSEKSLTNSTGTREKILLPRATCPPLPDGSRRPLRLRLTSREQISVRINDAS